jgi:hypothetical protein
MKVEEIVEAIAKLPPDQLARAEDLAIGLLCPR